MAFRASQDGLQQEEHRDEPGDRDTPVRLERVFGLWDAVMINSGSMIGAGIFISPKGVLVGVQSVGATLVIWAASGIFSLLGALCYAEMGTMIPKSGATYTYILEIFGNLPGFVFLWADVVAIRPSLVAIFALSFSYYSLRPFYPDIACPPPEASVKLLAVACIMLIMFINCWSVKMTSRVMNGTTIFKIMSLSFIIGSGLVFLCMGRNENFTGAFVATNVSGLGAALYSGLFSYGGWHNLNIVVEELKRPARNLPLAIIISMVIVTMVNTLANVAYFTLLSPPELLRSEAVASSYAANFLGSSISWMISAAVALSLFGSLTAVLFASSRQVFVGARNGQFPMALAMISIRRKTPVPSLAFLTLMSICFCFVDNIFILINFLGFVRWVSFGLATIGLLYLRVKQPERPRPYRVNIVVPIVFLIASVFLTAAGIMAEPVDAAYGAGILLSAVPVYFIAIWSRTWHPSWLKSGVRKWTIYCQKVMFSVPEEAHNK